MGQKRQKNQAKRQAMWLMVYLRIAGVDPLLLLARDGGNLHQGDSGSGGT